MNDITRREAIARLAALAAAPTFARVAMRPPLERIGLAVFTVRSVLARDFARTMQTIAEIGYRDLDMYIHESRLKPKDTRAILDRVGLTCRSARVATPALYRGWDRSLDAAKELGARWITLANVPYEERQMALDWQELFDVFNRVGEEARKRGIGFCYHNHDFELQPIEGKVPLDLMMTSTSPEVVKLQMDVYWMTKGGRDPVAEIARLGSRVASLHLKDMDRTSERGITTVGSGIIDFARVIKAARAAGVEDFYVEEDGPRDPMAAVRASFAHLRSLNV